MGKRGIIFGIALALALCALVATNSAAALAMAIIVIVVPIACLVLGKVRAKRTHLSFQLDPTCTVGQSHPLNIEVRRPGALRARIFLTLEFHSTLLGRSWEVPLTLTPSTEKVECFTLPINAQCCGNISVTLKKAQANDSLGLTRNTVPDAAFEGAYLAYPPIYELNIEGKRTSLPQLTGTVYDQARKGHDRTEVFDLREYHQGDTMGSIHWKLSARFDEPMVREASHPADYDIAILLDVHFCDPADAEALRILASAYSVAASVGLSLMQSGIPHAFIIPRQNGLSTGFVENRADFESALDQALSVELAPETSIDAREYREFVRMHGITKTILVTDQLGDDLLGKITGKRGLSVLHVSNGTAVSSEDLDGCTLTHIPVESVGTTMKGLEL